MNKTKHALVSMVTSAIFMVIVGILTFVRTGVIVKYLGSDINAITQIANQLFSYLILLESGLGTAYTYNMYAPLAKGDYNKTFSLYLGLNKSLKKVATNMIFCIIILSFIYPLLIKSTIVPYFQIALIILLLGIRFALPYYLYIAKKKLLIVQEKKYVVESIEGINNLIVLVLEIIMILFFKIRIEIVLSIGIIILFIFSKVYSKAINKYSSEIIKEEAEPSFEGQKMTKDIMMHQISGLILSSADNILLSIFKTLKSVTIYSAYDSLISYPSIAFGKLADTIGPSLGIKIARKDKNVFSVYNEILSLTLFLISIIATTFILMANKFVTLWIGEKYVIGTIPVILFTLMIIHKLLMPIILTIRNGRGMYKESKNYTLFQAIFNLILSLILVKPFGISGILFASVISTYFILQPFNFIIVYKKIFNTSLHIYKDLAQMMLSIILSTFIAKLLVSRVEFFGSLNWITFIIESLSVVAISIAISVLAMLLFNKYFINSIKRIKNNILRNIKI